MRPTIHSLDDLHRFTNIAEVIYKFYRFIGLRKRAEKWQAEYLGWATAEYHRLTTN